MATYATKSGAKRAARRMFGRETSEGLDWEIISSEPDFRGDRRWDYIPGTKYDARVSAEAAVAP